MKYWALLIPLVAACNSTEPVKVEKYCAHYGNNKICCSDFHATAWQVTLGNCERGISEIINATNVTVETSF